MKSDFLIVGAGVIGLATAWELVRAGASVEVLDRGPAGRESSWAGGGMLFPIWPWDYADAVIALTELACSSYPTWIAELQTVSGISPEYRQTGLLALPPADFARAKAWCAAHSLRADVVRGANISPLLFEHPQVLWLPDVAQVRNPRLTRALASALGSRQVVIRENTEVLEIVTDGRRAIGVRTKDDLLSSGSVIVSAGAWSRNLLGAHAAGADVFPVRGQMLLYETPPGTLDVMVLVGDRYLIPRADGHILAGSTQEYVGFDKATTSAVGAELHEAAKSMLPYLGDLQPVAHWAGLRPGSPGNIPVIARHPDIENLYLNSGHFRYGLTMAPAAAQVLVNLILSREQPLDVGPYAWPNVKESVAPNIN